MKAARFYGLNDVRIDDVPMPGQRDDQMIVKIHKALICNGSDTAILKTRRDMSRYRDYLKPPFIIGHEFAGEVVSIGRSIEGYEPGDRLTMAVLA